MAIICTTVTSFVVKDVLVPVQKWVSQLQQQCKALPWWNPLKWLCWFVTILVQVVVWVVEHIVVPILNVVCVLVSWFIGAVLMPCAVAIDAVCQSCNATGCILAWFFTPTAIEIVSTAPSATEPGYTDYVFKCNCKDPAKSQNITLTAIDDTQAADLAKEKCAKACA